MKQDTQYEGRCFCGAVRFTLQKEPEAMAYCHCDSCRKWSAGPVSAFSLWKPGNLNVTQGQENLTSFDKNPETGEEIVVSIRQWCKKCGGHVFTDHPMMGLVDVPVVVIKELKFKPSFHVHYQESVLPIKDGLSKFRDLPKAAGGSGVEVAE